METLKIYNLHTPSSDRFSLEKQIVQYLCDTAETMTYSLFRMLY